MSKKSIKNKLFLIFTLMGMIPLLAVLFYGGLRLAAHAENHAKTSGWLRNAIVNEHLNYSLQNNFYVLRTLAAAKPVINYLKTPNAADEAIIHEMLRNNDEIFHDNNLTVVTNAAGQQLVRSDNEPLVNVTQRRHFQMAMVGKEYVSDVIVSMSTSKKIVVLEVPIFDEQHNPIGMLQRNLNLENLEEFIQAQADENTAVIIMDQENQVIAHSDTSAVGTDDTDYYKKILRIMDSDNGVGKVKLNDHNTFVTCSHNQLTNWSVATVQPASAVYRSVNNEIIQAGIIGLLLLLLVSLMSHFLANRITVPIRKICQVVTDLVKGSNDISKLEILSEDELGEMATAINEMRFMRDNMRQEAERDELTSLCSRTAVESNCRQRLQEYEESFAPGMLAIFLIDLDNFKKATKDEGHQHGNRILQNFANGLKDIFRAYDCVGRLEGDEFVVIIDHQTDLTIIKRKAAEINKMARELTIGGENVGITASIGIAIAPQNGKTFNHLLHAADLALFAAKEKGRDCYEIAGEEDGEFDNLK